MKNITFRNEGNFHIFYYFYDGVSQSERLKSFGLTLGRNYKYLAPHPFDNEVTNGQNLKKIEEALSVRQRRVCVILFHF